MLGCHQSNAVLLLGPCEGRFRIQLHHSVRFHSADDVDGGGAMEYNGQAGVCGLRKISCRTESEGSNCFQAKGTPHFFLRGVLIVRNDNPQGCAFRSVFFWLINSGARAEDVLRLKNFQLNTSTAILTLNFDVAKNVRSTGEGQQIRVKLRMRDPVCEARIANGEIPTVGETVINGVLLAVAHQLKWEVVDAAECRRNEDLSKRAPTTYSFRHLFIQHAIEVLTKHTDVGDIVNWTEIVQLTGHQSKKKH